MLRTRQVIFSAVLMAACLMLPAGRVDWPGAWVLIGLCSLAVLLTGAAVARRNPGLIAERARGFGHGKAWDKVLSPIMALFGPMAIWITAGLEARRYWPGRLPGFVVFAGAGLAVAAMPLVAWALLSNRFFSTVVRIQKDRGHVVETGGPYRFVRHPGYAGSIVFTMATPLILDSRWALWPALATSAVVVLRTALEDRTLRRELEGYAAYAARVKYRLAPGIW